LGGILLLKSQPRKIKAGRVIALPACAISTKNKHLLLSHLAIPTRGFTAVLSVFRGTPSTKPLRCTIRLTVADDAICRAWADHIGDDSKLVLAKFNLSPEDITWMSLDSLSQSVFVRLSLIVVRAIKNPAYVSVSRVRKKSISIRYLLTSSLSKVSVFWPKYAMDSLRLNAQPGFDRL
jgi:hypothetical protein